MFYESDTIKSTRNRVIRLYSKYFVSNIFIPMCSFTLFVIETFDAPCFILGKLSLAKTPFNLDF